MVAHVLRLRIALMVGALRGERATATIVGLILVVVVTAMLCVATLSVTALPLPVARALIVIGGASVFVAFLCGPVVAGTTDQLDPRRFASFGLEERRMPWILALMSLVSVPALALTAIGVCMAIVAIELGTPWPIAVASGAVGLFSIVLCARIGMATSALLLPERRPRELTAIFALVVVTVAFPLAVFLASLGWRGSVPPAMDAAVGVIGASPIAATLGASFAVAAGDESMAILSAVVAIATLVVLLVVWKWLVHRLMTTVEKPSASRERSGLGWFALVPSTPGGAIAARSLTYWFRDRRYIVNLAIVPIAAVLTAFPLAIAGVPLHIAALVPVLVMALFFGWLPHNDIAYDSTAFWAHVASGVRGLPDRIGRLAPIVLVGLPVLAVATAVSLSVAGSWHMLPALVGLTACLFGVTLGLSSIASVTSPYAVTRPGDSPFQQPQRGASNSAFAPAMVFLGAIVLSAPTVWLFAMSISRSAKYGMLTLGVGATCGLLLLLICLLIGGRIFDRSGERLMEFVETS